MSGIEPAAVTSRSTSHLGMVELIMREHHLSPEARMELIARQVTSWRGAVAGSVAAFSAARDADAFAERAGKSWASP